MSLRDPCASVTLTVNVHLAESIRTIEQLTALNKAVSCDITASGGVTNIDDIIALNDKGLYGAICGKSIYKGTLDLKQAVEVCK